MFDAVGGSSLPLSELFAVMNQALSELCRQFWDWYLENDPLTATYLGDMRYNDRLPDIGAKALERRALDLSQLERRIASLTLMEAEDHTTTALLRMRIDELRDEIRHNFHQWTLDQLQGPQVWLLELVNYHPLKGDHNLQTLAARYRAFPRYIGDFIANLQDGQAQGRVAPQIVVDRVLGQLEDLLKTPVAESALNPRQAPKVQASEAVLADVEKAISDAVYPAYASLRDYLKTYAGRDTVGLSVLPGGEAAYAFRVKMHTTTSMNPRQVHELGLASVDELEEEMLAIAQQLGHTGDLASFRQKLKAEGKNFYQSRDELLEDYRATLGRVEEALPRYFGRLPKSPCEIKPIETFRERDCIAAYYYPPSDDFSRLGIFYVNTYQPETRPRYNRDALTVHEAVPGHHLQIALAMEQDDLPDFRRHGMFTAYVEGWALYTERLADEMGIYRTPLDRFGMLTFQIWRAARLVVDTGMHSLKWTRQQAIDYFEEHVGLPSNEIANEIDRYIVMPGQALAYFIGMNEILSLRRLAEEKLGSRFDVKAFHDELLRYGALPLLVLRALMKGYIQMQGAAVH